VDAYPAGDAAAAGGPRRAPRLRRQGQGPRQHEKFFKDMPERAKAPSTSNALLHAYVQHGAWNKAESMLTEMAQVGYLTCALPFSHMMSLYMACGELKRVPEMIKELRRYTRPDLVTYNIWLTYCSKDSVKSAEKVFDLMRDDKVVPDWMTFSLMATIYINAGLHVKGRDALTEMEKRASRNERAAYSSLLTLYASLQDRGNLDRVWNKMRETFRKFSDTEYKSMLTSLIRFGDITEALIIYDEWEIASGVIQESKHDPYILHQERHGGKGREFLQLYCGKGSQAVLPHLGVICLGLSR
jgi:pentatricopeptide repeat protein